MCVFLPFNTQPVYTINALYLRTYCTHQLQLKRDTRGTRKDHARYTRIFLVIYMQLHAMSFTCVYRPPRIFTTCLHAKLIFARTRVCVCIELTQSTAKRI